MSSLALRDRVGRRPGVAQVAVLAHITSILFVLFLYNDRANLQILMAEADATVRRSRSEQRDGSINISIRSPGNTVQSRRYCSNNRLDRFVSEGPVGHNELQK
jgi:hypothetical protein